MSTVSSINTDESSWKRNFGGGNLSPDAANFNSRRLSVVWPQLNNSSTSQVFRGNSGVGSSALGLNLTHDYSRISSAISWTNRWKKEIKHDRGAYRNESVKYIVCHIVSWLSLVSLICVDIYVCVTEMNYRNVSPFLRLPEQYSIFLTVIKGFVYIGLLVCHCFRSYQLKCHHHQFSYYRPHFMGDWISDALTGSSYLTQLFLAAVVPYFHRQATLYFLFWLHLMSTCSILVCVMYSYYSMLRHNSAENRAPMSTDLAEEFKIVALKKRQIIPSARYYKVCRVIGVHLNQNVRAAHAAIYVTGAYCYICQVLIGKGFRDENQNEYDYQSDGVLFSIVYLLGLFFVLLFAWFWYENFILKDIGVIYTSPWIIFFFVLIYGFFTYDVKEVTDKVVAYKNQLEAAQEVVSENEMQYGWEDWFGEEETVMRDVILATILMGLALKIVVLKEVMSEAPAKEAEDDFYFARTRDYRHVVGNRGAAVDKSSLPSFSISESDSAEITLTKGGSSEMYVDTNPNIAQLASGGHPHPPPTSTGAAATLSDSLGQHQQHLSRDKSTTVTGGLGYPTTSATPRIIPTNQNQLENTGTNQSIQMGRPISPAYDPHGSHRRASLISSSGAGGSGGRTSKLAAIMQTAALSSANRGGESRSSIFRPKRRSFSSSLDTRPALQHHLPRQHSNLSEVGPSDSGGVTTPAISINTSTDHIGQSQPHIRTPLDGSLSGGGGGSGGIRRRINVISPEDKEDKLEEEKSSTETSKDSWSSDGKAEISNSKVVEEKRNFRASFSTAFDKVDEDDKSDGQSSSFGDEIEL
ncbi:uncharacterized protein LOC142341067 [Convolutriloba macropyga]|uniref:uncharacterized protein LOC142341067 n=1 Tax=Convolutriloba macropyga TaxID=536237 RepID=UPI003F51E0E5